MKDAWYIARGKQRCGPFTYEQVRQMAASSVLSPHDMVFNEGASQWVEAENVPGLFPAAVPCLPPEAPVEPAEPRRWQDFGEALVPDPSPTPAREAAQDTSPPSARREEVPEVRPAQQPAPARNRLDAALGIAVALSLPLLVIGGFFFGDGLIGRPISILVGLIWLAAGGRAAATGIIADQRGRLYRRPVLYRIVGIVVALLGMGVLGRGLADLVASIPKIAERLASAPRAQNTRPAKEAAVPRKPPATEVHKDERAVLRYEGKKAPFALWLVPGVWRQSWIKDNPDAEVEFTHKGGEAWALVIAERIQMPVDVLKKAALENFRKRDKDAKIVREETRLVNGAEVLCLTVNASSPEGVPVTVHGYYYAGPQGAIQVLTVTGQNLFQELQPELEGFLNGFEIVKGKPGPSPLQTK